MQEMDVLSINGGGELRIGIEFRFPGPPVVALLPVLDQALDRVQGNTVVRTHTRELIAPANTGEALF